MVIMGHKDISEFSKISIEWNSNYFATTGFFDGNDISNCQFLNQQSIFSRSWVYLEWITIGHFEIEMKFLEYQ